MSSFIASFSSERFAMIRFIRAFSSRSRGRERSRCFPCHVLGLPGGNGVRVHAVPAPKLDERGARVVLSENRDDLRLGEAGFPHAGSLRLSAWETHGISWPGFPGQRQRSHITALQAV
jgi:hypothetical protein